MVLFKEVFRWSTETKRGHFLLADLWLLPRTPVYLFLLELLLLLSDLLNIRLGWFLLVTIEVITVGSFSKSTLSDLLSRTLAVSVSLFELSVTFVILFT